MDKEIFDGIVAGMEDAIAFLQGDDTRAEVVYVPAPVDVKGVRKRAKMTQVDFSRTFGIPLQTLRNWECGAREPESATRAYLNLIDQDPAAVQALIARRGVDTARV
jgi:putative transcriptional regulator